MSQRPVYKVLMDVVDSKSRVPVDAEVMDIRGGSIGQPGTRLAKISQAPAKSHCQAGGMKKIAIAKECGTQEAVNYHSYYYERNLWLRF